MALRQLIETPCSYFHQIEPKLKRSSLFADKTFEGTVRVLILYQSNGNIQGSR